MPLSTVKKQADQAHQDAPPPAQSNPEKEFDFFRVRRDGDGNFKDVTILHEGFRCLLRRMGFLRYDQGETFIIVQIVDNVIEQVTPHRLRATILRYFHEQLPEDLKDLTGCPKDALIEKLIRSMGTLTSDVNLSLLVDLDSEEKELPMVEDTKEAAFYFYLNGWVEVTKDGCRLRPYSELPGCIWRDRILPRNFTPISGAEQEKGIYYQFANNVADNWLRPDGVRNNPGRFVSFVTITGYFLHRFFKTNLRAGIFLDARVSDEPDGRSGKSLHTKALRHMMNTDEKRGKQCIVVDGKLFDPENRFKYERLHPSTRLFVLDDVKRGLNIEMFFNSILDGFEQERKGLTDRAIIETKLIMTLNYTVSIHGGSAMDRVIEFEFADFYSSRKKPEVVHNCWFFRDWDAEEWNRFDNFMLSCLSDYLRLGLIMPDTINLEARKLLDDTNLMFVHFMEDLQIQHQRSYNKKDLYIQFTDADPQTGKPRIKDLDFLKQHLFTKWLKWWCQFRPEMAGYQMHRSNGADFIRFFHNAPIDPEYLEGATLFPGKSELCVPAEPKEGDTPF